MTNSVRTAQIVLVIGAVLLVLAVFAPNDDGTRLFGIGGVVCIGVGLWDLFQDSRRKN